MDASILWMKRKKKKKLWKWWKKYESVTCLFHRDAPEEFTAKPITLNEAPVHAIKMDSSGI